MEEKQLVGSLIDADDKLIYADPKNGGRRDSPQDLREKIDAPSARYFQAMLNVMTEVQV